MARAFIQHGVWRLEPTRIVDAPAQKRATLRVSALAAFATLALAAVGASPPAPAGPHARAQAPSHTVVIAMPEMVTAKMEDRVPSLAGPANPLRRRGTDVDTVAVLSETTATTRSAAATASSAREAEALDPALIRAGDTVFRLAGIIPPDQSRICRRLDGLAVPCVDRAHSYLQLLVKGRAVTCERVPDQGETPTPAQAHCRVGDADLGEQLIRHGWASAAPQPEERFQVAEAAARKQRLGIWRE